MTNHIPVLGTVFGLLLLAYGMWKGSGELKRVALGVFVLVTVLAVPAYLSGEPAEDVVNGLPGVTHAVIEEHEEMAGVAFTAQVVLGVGALVLLIMGRKGKSLSNPMIVSALAAALIVSVLMAWTALLGGHVRHTEIRGSAVIIQHDKD